MIRVAMQLLAIAAAMGGVVVYGMIRDRQEHKAADSGHIAPQRPSQEAKFLNDPNAQGAAASQHRGAAMSQLS
jgi:hypothetical protein